MAPALRNFSQQGEGVGNRQLQVFRSQTVHKPDARLHVVRHEDGAPVLEGAPGQLVAWQGRKLSVQGAVQGRGELLACGDADGGCERIVLRLGKHVRCQELRGGAFVGQDGDFRRPGDHVDADLAHEQGLGRCNVDVARPGDDIAGSDGRGAVGQRRDAPGAACAVDLREAEQCCRGQNVRLSVESLRGGEMTAMSVTPATWAGTAFMIRLEMSGVSPPWPPGTYRPTRSTGAPSARARCRRRWW